MSAFNNLLSSLRQRKIGQTVVVYLGSAWVILEAFGFFGQRYGWDQRLFDAFLVLLLFGLPAAVLIRWFQESSSSVARRRQVYLLSVNVILAATFVMLTWRHGAATSTKIIASLKDGRSIAVL